MRKGEAKKVIDYYFEIRNMDTNEIFVSSYIVFHNEIYVEELEVCKTDKQYNFRIGVIIL